MPGIFDPLALGPIELPCRIVSTAHQTTLVHDHLPTDDFIAYHQARARGGAGLIVLEATAVDPTGLLTPHTLGGYLPEIVDGYRRVAAAVRPHGTRLFVQLFHGGREQIAGSGSPRAPALAPSAVPSQRYRVEPRALRAGEIDELIAGYAHGAELAEAGGLDGVEVSAAHRYLIEQFADPGLNVRDDEWSDGERFLREVLRAIREAAPKLVLGVRLSASSQVAPLLARVGAEERVDYLSLALGDSSSYLGSTGIVPPPPEPENTAADRVGPFRLGVPLVLTSRIVDPAAGDRLVTDGVADAVGMTRALITDPDLPAKAAAGRGGEVVRCIGCNVCIAHYHAGAPIACAMNPRTGRELHLPRSDRASRRHRLVVVGAGPAGLAAAAEAAGAGHEAIVLERSSGPGGQMTLAGPGGGEITRRLLENYSAVDVRTGTEADPESVAALEPDAVVVATGARPYRPELALDDVSVAQSWDVLAGPLPEGERVVIADWGGDPSGLDAGEVLRAAGRTVTIAIASVAVGEMLHQYRRNLYLRRLYRAGVSVLHHLELAGAGGGEVRFRNAFAPELETALPVDLLVLALGRVPEDRLGPELAAAGLTVEEAGDCRSPRSLEEAILEGTLAARRVFAEHGS